MKIPSFKRLVYTDFPQQYQQLVEQLSYTVNNSIESITQALTNNISLRDNLLTSVKDVTLQVDANGIPLSTASFAIGNTNTIDGLQVIRAINNTNSTVFPSAGIFVSYAQSGSKITILNVTGLPANNLFSLRIVAWLT